MSSRAVRLLATLVLLTAAVAGCSSSAGGGAKSNALVGEITVFAASSLTEAFTALAKQFQASHPGSKVTFRFDASSALAIQITEGNKADVFASASVKNMDAVSSAGDAEQATDFARNTMEIATPPGNPAQIASVADLAKSGVKVALCDPAVPCGATARKVFDNAKITVKPASLEPDVKSTLAKVEIKEVHAGVVYVTDVRAAGGKVTGVKIPRNLNASTTYPISALKHSSNKDLAQAWVDYVLSTAGRKALRTAGFSAP